MRRDLLRSFLTEIKFVKSAKDVKLAADKLPFGFRRLTGRYANSSRVPPSMQIEPTNVCNANCISCPRENMRRKKGYMDLSLFRKIIDDAAHSGVKRVYLYLHGESLLHAQIVEMIAYLKSSRLSLNLATNGMLLTEGLGDAILRCGLDSGDYIVFSILGNSTSVHEAMMKGIHHDTVLRNVAGFLKSRKKLGINGPIVKAMFYPMKENEAEAPLFQREWRRRVDRATVADRISKSFAGSEANGGASIRTKTCSQLWEKITVYWTGDVVPCCVDINAQHVLGNLLNRSIKDLWNSDELLSMRKLHRERRFSEIELCERCDM